MRFFTRLAYSLLTVLAVMFVASALGAHAASPSGNDWYQITANPSTGSDNTGDGGTGLPADLNYFYVGQSFVGTMQINVDSSPGSNASNIWIEYPTTTVSASSLTTGSFFPTWSGQVVSSTIGRIYSTGFRTSGYSSGLGTFGTVTWTMLKPSAAAYGTTAATLDINIGTVGATTESNISYDGTDILDDAEDFRMLVWADTKKPYALNPAPANAATAVAIDSNYTFDLRDSKNGEGDNSGVGTGVNTTEPPGAITTDDGGGAVDVTGFDSFSCSGIWGTNLCSVTINPNSPLSIAGDTRNWKYSTTYTVTVSGFRDLASASQNQLGDANGPNTMDTKVYTFTTEADTVAPQVVAETPARSSTGNAPSTNIVIDVQDRKTYPSGPSGTGIDATTCRFNVSSPSVALTTYQQGSSGVTVTAIDYGYRFTINPATDFAQNETVSVSAYNCADLASNVMTTDNWTFSTADSAAPYVTGESPSNDQTASTTQSATFHIKDDGVGVDLSNTVIYFNGNYYTNGGGAGSVTTNGTRITFGSSLNFNGGNYVGDTTSRTGTVNDETFTLDPQSDYSAGEAVPVIIYSRDLSGNLMERVVYAFVAEGVSSSCPAGSSFCGTGTTWDGSHCVATGGSGGGSCSTSGGGSLSAIALEINEPTVSVMQIDEHSVLVTWATNLPSTGLVVYDTKHIANGAPPRYEYSYQTQEVFSTSTYHAIEIRGLQSGIIYYFRPVSRIYDEAAGGLERLILTRTPNEAAAVNGAPAATTPTGEGTVPACAPAAPAPQPAPVLCPVPAPLAPPASGQEAAPGATEAPVASLQPSNTTTVVHETEIQWLERVRSVIPPGVGYALIGLAALLALSTLLLLRMRDPKYAALAIAMAILVLCSAVVGAYILNREDAAFMGGSPSATRGAPIDARGGVLAPFGESSVSGIDLTLGDTSIHTQTGGQFAFPDAHVGDRIRINQPLLHRPVEWQLATGTGPIAIPFDVEMYNALDDAMQASGIRASDSIVVTGASVDASSHVIRFETLADGKSASYSLVYQGGAWKPAN